MAQRIDLDDEAALQTLHLAQLDDPVENSLPVLVASEVVVGDEQLFDTLGVVGAQDQLNVSGRAVAVLAALHINDGAEAALERAASATIETGSCRRRTADRVAW